MNTKVHALHHPPGYPVPIIHKFDSRNGLACGQPAFFMKHEPVEGEALEPGDVVMPDGRQPYLGEMMRCGSCHEEFTPNQLSW